MEATSTLGLGVSALTLNPNVVVASLWGQGFNLFIKRLQAPS
jgi:hypothetical protein